MADDAAMIAGEDMQPRISTLAQMLIAVLCFGACVPDVVSLEAVPTHKFSRDLAQCRAAIGEDAFIIGNPVKQCMKAKGYRFLRNY